jgi:hypothetical protein
VRFLPRECVLYIETSPVSVRRIVTVRYPHLIYYNELCDVCIRGPTLICDLASACWVVPTALVQKCVWVCRPVRKCLKLCAWCLVATAFKLPGIRIADPAPLALWGSRLAPTRVATADARHGLPRIRHGLPSHCLSVTLCVAEKSGMALSVLR